jgi:glutamate 5-kinase
VVTKERIQAAGKRLVVKLGTSTICDDSGVLDPDYLAGLAAQVADLVKRKAEVVIVSSGAIRAGLDLLDLPHQPRAIALKQAAAAVGQSRLMQMYATAFAQRSLKVAQLLLTRDDFHDRRRYVHAGNTLRALLKLGVIPIINENDTIAVDEIKVGDNDSLAALVAGLVGAHLLVLLSSGIDGLHTGDPTLDPEARLIPRVTDLDEIKRHVGASASDWGTGGMRTKIEAASLCMRSRIPMVIANGRKPGILAAVLDGREGTLFEPPVVGKMPARKRWIAGGQRPAGVITVNDGACDQLLHCGRSLLPAGIIAVQGDFHAGDIVVVEDAIGDPIGRGIVNYDHATLREIMGKQTAEVHSLYGGEVSDEVIHRDNLVMVVRD